MPKIDWAEMLRPVDLSELGGDPASDLTYAYAETLAPDPLVAAAMAVTATEQAQQNRQRQMRRPAASVSPPASQPHRRPARAKPRPAAPVPAAGDRSR